MLARDPFAPGALEEPFARKDVGANAIAVPPCALPPIGFVGVDLHVLQILWMNNALAFTAIMALRQDSLQV